MADAGTIAGSLSGPVIVMGLGITGRAVASALLRREIDVIALDDRITNEMQGWAAGLDLQVHTSAEIDLAATCATAQAVLPAPGLPDSHHIFSVAHASGTGVLSEFDLAAAWDERPTVAVTGTDGKTTVVTLIAQMLNKSGIRAQAVGNTDTPWVEAIDDATIDTFVVEASSFRLGHSAAFAPQVAAWLNFGPDHLDAHRDLEAYELAKASIWSQLDGDALAVSNRDDAIVSLHADRLTVPVETFGHGAPPTSNDHGVVDGMLVSGGASLVAVKDMPRAMPHDILNGLAAAACARRAGAQTSAMVEVLQSFDGLKHRVQFVAEIDGVRYINDSKATTPHAAAAALGAFESIVLLAGGKNKGLSFDAMLNHVDRIHHVIALGDAAADVQAVFQDHTTVLTADSMQAAVDLAASVARPSDAVLLSPACASYDWYKSYRHRGDDFIQIVHARQAESERS